MNNYQNLGRFSSEQNYQPNPYYQPNPGDQSQQVDWSQAPGIRAPEQTPWLQRNIIDNPWIDGAFTLGSFIPGIGGALNAGWQGTRGLYHLANHNYGQAAEAAAWGAAGLIPGGAAAKLGRMGMGGVKALRAGESVIAGVNAARKAAPTVGRLGRIAGIAGDVGMHTGIGFAAPGIASKLPDRGQGMAQSADRLRYGAPVTDFSSYGNNLMQQAIDQQRLASGHL